MQLMNYFLTSLKIYLVKVILKLLNYIFSCPSASPFSVPFYPITSPHYIFLFPHFLPLSIYVPFFPFFIFVPYSPSYFLSVFNLFKSLSLLFPYNLSLFYSLSVISTPIVSLFYPFLTLHSCFLISFCVPFTSILPLTPFTPLLIPLCSSFPPLHRFPFHSPSQRVFFQPTLNVYDP